MLFPKRDGETHELGGISAHQHVSIKDGQFHVTYMILFLFIGLSWWQLSLIAAEHWLQDRSRFVAWYMRAFGKSEFAKPPLAPWSFIVMDNVFHLTWIAFIVWLGTDIAAP